MEIQQKPVHHYDFELLPCPFCKGGATALPSRISCDVCLCNMEKGSSQTYEELVASWNSREGIEAAERMSDGLERHHYERWMGSRNSSNPPIPTEPMDAWFARSQLEVGPKKLREQADHNACVMPPSIGERIIDRTALVSNLAALMEMSKLPLANADPEALRKTACDAFELLEQYDGVLRNLCMFLSAGGWNSDGLIDPALADKKIRWGIDYMLKVDWPRPVKGDEE